LTRSGKSTNGGRALVVLAAREPGKSLFAEHLGDRRGTELDMLFAEGVGDVVHREVALAHLDDEAPGTRLLRLLLRPVCRLDEEGALGVVPEVVAEDTEGGGGVPEGPRDLGARSMLDEVGAQGLVLAMPRLLGREEELGRIA
jgi:hypothetical protein